MSCWEISQMTTHDLSANSYYVDVSVISICVFTASKLRFEGSVCMFSFCLWGFPTVQIHVHRRAGDSEFPEGLFLAPWVYQDFALCQLGLA